MRSDATGDCSDATSDYLDATSDYPDATSGCPDTNGSPGFRRREREIHTHIRIIIIFPW